MRQIICVDISHYSFEEFVEFVFDHDIPPEAEMPTAEERASRWYYSAKPTFDPERLSGHYVRLFCESARLLGLFSESQLELGFSAVESRCTFSVKNLIWNTNLPFEHRERVVQSMFYLYRDFLQR